MVDEELQAFLFRAATGNVAVEELVERGELLGPERPADPTRSTPLDDFSFAIRVEAGRMARVYELLFCFENSVRELIESRLKEAFGIDGWWAEGVPEDLRTKASKLEQREKRTPWHGPRGGTLLAYVDFPDLGRIITEGWQHFEDLLGQAEWVKNLFDETNQTRRAIAHTGVLSQHDIERMELRVRDWLRVVG